MATNCGGGGKVVVPQCRTYRIIILLIRLFVIPITLHKHDKALLLLHPLLFWSSGK